MMELDAIIRTFDEQLKSAMSDVVRMAHTSLAKLIADVEAERARGLTDTDARRAEKEVLHREVAAMNTHKEQQEGRVELNIGGRRFHTSVQTLRRVPNTFFDAYFSGRYAQDVCEDGSIFVDRDGEHFGHVLEYMRDGVISVGQEANNTLKREFDFYSIEPLVKQAVIIAMGGRNGGTVLSDVERYDVQSGVWETLAPMEGGGRASFGMCCIDGSLFVSGGWDGNNYVDTVQKYSVVDDTWMTLAPMPGGPRYRHQAYAVGKSMHVIGGQGQDRRVITDACKFDTQANVWIPCAALPEVRRFFSGCVLGPFIYIFGGWDSECCATDSIFRFDSRNEQWERLPSVLPEPRLACAVVVLGTAIYAVGGRDANNAVTSSVWRFDPNTGMWAAVAPMSIARSGLQLVALGGCLYAAGGVLGGLGGEVLCDLVERYDPAPAARNWSSCAPLRTSRRSYRTHVVRMLADPFQRRRDEEDAGEGEGEAEDGEFKERQVVAFSEER
jgi:N-acetylneuraminic acid mutarotase